MKIALVGAQGVGKSTLARQLGGVVVPEVARDCPYPIDDKADFRTEWWMVAHSILAEMNATQGAELSDLIIADRCVLDIAVYSRLVNQQDPRRLSFDQLYMLESTISSWLYTEPYDHIFLLSVPENQWLKRDLDDGFRSLDIEWFRKVASNFRKAATRLVPPNTQLHYITNDGTMEQLVAKVQTELKLSGIWT